MKHKLLHLEVSSFPKAQEAFTEVSKEIKKNFASLNRIKLNKEQASDIFLSSFKHVPESVNKHLDIINALYGQLDKLTRIKLDLKNSFYHMSQTKGLIERINKLEVSAKTKLDSSLELMTKQCQKYQPPYFTQSQIKIQKWLTTFAPCTQLTLARCIVRKEQVVASQFVTYFRWDNIKDSTGFMHPNFFTILSCTVDQYGRFKMGWYVSPDFLKVGTFKSMGYFGSHASGINQIRAALSEHGIAKLKDKGK